MDVDAPGPSPPAVRVMIADDHETLRQGLRSLFNLTPDIKVVHEASDGEAALAAVRWVAPDILVMDLSMPRADGLTVLRRLREARRQTKVIVLTRYRESGYIREAFATGASGYVLKQSSFLELRRAIDAVTHGRRYLDTAIIATAPAFSDTEMPPASTRELEVLRRAALGDSNRTIAEALDIAVKTVEVHKANAMRKLGLTNRRDLVRYAALHGWFDDA